MPLKKRGRRTFKRGAKRRGRKRVRGGMSKVVKRVIHSMEEKKFFTNSGGQVGLGMDYALTNAALFGSLAQGTQRNQRVGSKVSISSIEFKFVMAAGSVGGAGLVGVPARIRLLCVLDKQYNGAAGPVAIADLMADPTIPQNFYYGILNPSTVGPRYKLIFDKFFDMNVEGGVTDQAVRKHLFIRKRLNYTITYRDLANTGTNTDVEKNMLILYTMSDQTGLTVPNAGLEFIWRFTDI